LRRQHSAYGGVTVGLATHELRIGALDGLREQVREAHGFARATLEDLLVATEHGAERNVLRARGRREPTDLRANGEHHREMLCLRRADEVEQPRTAQHLRAVTQRREIRGGVAVAAVLLADD